MEDVINATVTSVFAQYEKRLEELPPEAQIEAMNRILQSKKALTDALCARLNRKRDANAELVVDPEDVREALLDVAGRGVLCE